MSKTVKTSSISVPTALSTFKMRKQNTEFLCLAYFFWPFLVLQIKLTIM